MATPLEVRNRRREAQRTVRLAINACNCCIDAWKAAITDGKEHATNLTNVILSLGHIPQLPLGALNDVPNLKTAAMTKLATEIDRRRALLVKSLTFLEFAAGFSDAVAPLRDLDQQEESDSLLHKTPVFTTFSLHTITNMFEGIEQKYLAELERKKTVVQDFLRSAATAENFVATATSNESNSSTSLKGVSSSIECTEGYLQVHITAWMLSPEVEDTAVQADLALIKQDAASC